VSAKKAKPTAKKIRQLKPKAGGGAKASPAQKRAKGELDPKEWDFSQIPPEELNACFLWEYARESVWLRDLRKRCLSFWQKSKEVRRDPDWRSVLHRIHNFSLDSPSPFASDPDLDADFRSVREAMPHKSEVFLSGFSLEPERDNGNFPKPWQALSKAERAGRATAAHHIAGDAAKIPLTAFGRGHVETCELIRDQARRDQAQQHHPAPESRRHWLPTHGSTAGGHRHHADPERLRHKGGVRSSMLWKSGREEGVFQIEWARFTDKEIADHFRKWVGKHRPDNFPEPSRNGNKTEDRRAWLEWLGAMRCLKQLSFAHNAFPARLKRHGAPEIYRMRKKARQRFRKLFAFCPQPLEPLSFETGRSRQVCTKG